MDGLSLESVLENEKLLRIIYQWKNGVILNPMRLKKPQNGTGILAMTYWGYSVKFKRMPKDVILAIDEASKKSCYDLCPELTTHDNVWFWIGFNKAVEIMQQEHDSEINLMKYKAIRSIF